MQVVDPSHPSTPELEAHIRKVLADAGWPADTAVVQRLLKQLQRVEPASRVALAQATTEPPHSFEACLNESRQGDPA